ncbi:MAG: hypothetical protein ACH350_08570 [Parachlamydiaceae bacterium]
MHTPIHQSQMIEVSYTSIDRIIHSQLSSDIKTQLIQQVFSDLVMVSATQTEHNQTLKLDNQRLSQLNYQLNCDYHELAEVNRSLSDRVDILAKENESNVEANGDLKKKIECVVNQRLALAKEIDALEVESALLKSKLTDLVSEKEDLIKQIDQKTIMILECEQKNKTHLVAMHSLKKEVEKLEKKSEGLELEIETREVLKRKQEILRISDLHLLQTTFAAGFIGACFFGPLGFMLWPAFYLGKRQTRSDRILRWDNMIGRKVKEMKCSEKLIVATILNQLKAVVEPQLIFK